MIKGQQAGALQFLNAWVKDYNQKLALLKGYAGTGKTWLVGHWLEEHYFKQFPKRLVFVLAPTNKALDVLREKCGHLQEQYTLRFCTIDAFLGNRIKKNDDGDTVKSQGKGMDNPDLIICDEGSMVKKEYDESLRRRGVKTLYVGDPAQLPPINEEISSVFSIQNQFEMTEVVRFDGAIIKVATFLRERIESRQFFTVQDLQDFRDPERTLTFIGMHNLHDWAIKAVQKGLDARIVAFQNAVVDEHNATIHRILYPDAPLFGEGERVVVNETFEYPLGYQDQDGEEATMMLYNGETMIVKSCEYKEDVEGVEIFEVRCVPDRAGNIEVTTEEDGAEKTEVYTPDPLVLNVCLDNAKCAAVHKSLTNAIWEGRRNGRPEYEIKDLLKRRAPLNKLAPLRHSYSCTVHKSQGSTYDIAFADWSSIYQSKDRARMMYVATTRPSKFLVVASR